MSSNDPTAAGTGPAIDPATGRARDLEAQVLTQAMQDPAFRARLLADPKAVFAERGLRIPPQVTVQALIAGLLSEGRGFPELLRQPGVGRAVRSSPPVS